MNQFLKIKLEALSLLQPSFQESELCECPILFYGTWRLKWFLVDIVPASYSRRSRTKPNRILGGKNEWPLLAVKQAAIANNFFSTYLHSLHSVQIVLSVMSTQAERSVQAVPLQADFWRTLSTARRKGTAVSSLWPPSSTPTPGQRQAAFSPTSKETELCWKWMFGEPCKRLS